MSCPSNLVPDSRTAFPSASLHRASLRLTRLCSVVPFVKNDGADIVLESLLQRAFIKSKAIDVEALCIYTGKRVWRLKVSSPPPPPRRPPAALAPLPV